MFMNLSMALNALQVSSLFRPKENQDREEAEGNPTDASVLGTVALSPEKI
jgi:hypothetical protein